MVNVAGRSKGCATCRKRKLKCDLALPECRRCITLGVRCPGPRTDAFFVHTVSNGSDGTASSVGSVSSIGSVSSMRSASSSMGSSSPSPPRMRAKALRSPQQYPSHYSSTMTDDGFGQLIPQSPIPGPQPSKGVAFDQLFVSHFIDSFYGSRPPFILPKTWLDDLPVFLSDPNPCAAKHAIRATCMLSYATVSNNKAFQNESRKWYSKALQDMQTLLSKPDVAVTDSAVCAAVMFIHFETWAGTRPKAWVPHCRGAALLLASAGVDACRSGFMHQIFRHLRLQTCLAAMAENHLHVFAAPEWMTVPFEIYKKTFFDRLVDILFSVQRCLSAAQQKIRSSGDEADKFSAYLETLIVDTLQLLHSWRLEHPAFKTHIDETRRDSKVSIDDAVLVPGGDPGHFPTVPYIDTPSASLASFYHAASLIVFRLYHLVSPTSYPYDERALHHAEAVLAACEFIAERAGPSLDRSSIIMSLQLKMATLWSPTRKLRQKALDTIQEERIQKSGLVSVAELSREHFAEVAMYIAAVYDAGE